MPGRLEERLRIAELRRQVRVPAAEIDAAVIGPVRVYDSHPHASSLRLSSRMGSFCSASQPDRSRSPARQPIEGLHASASRSFRVSATKDNWSPSVERAHVLTPVTIAQ